jgi:hypothetical protein
MVRYENSDLDLPESAKVLYSGGDSIVLGLHLAMISIQLYIVLEGIAFVDRFQRVTFKFLHCSYR